MADPVNGCQRVLDNIVDPVSIAVPRANHGADKGDELAQDLFIGPLVASLGRGHQPCPAAVASLAPIRHFHRFNQVQIPLSPVIGAANL